MNFTESQILLFFLILVRLTSMIMAAPIYGERGIPMLLKIGFAGLISLIIFPLVNQTTGELQLNIYSAVVLVFGEAISGVTIGMIIKFLFAGVEMAGQYIGTDMGLAMAQAFDPMFQQQVAVIARFKNILALLLFVLIDGHHFLIEAVTHSFSILPIGTWHISQLAIDKIMRASAQVFVLGVKIAAPAIVTLFLTSVAMGLTARAVPQMNIFFVGFPLRISVGFLSLIMAFPLFFYVFKKLLTVFENDTMYILRVM